MPRDRLRPPAAGALALGRPQCHFNLRRDPSYEILERSPEGTGEGNGVIVRDGLRRGESALQSRDPVLIDEQNPDLDARLVLGREHIVERKQLHPEGGYGPCRRTAEAAQLEKLAREELLDVVRR